MRRERVEGECQGPARCEREGAEKATYRAQPDVIVLEKGTACEFEVFLTAHCTCSIRDILRAAGMTTVKQSFNVQVDVEAETTITTLLHCDEIVTAKQIGEPRHGLRRQIRGMAAVKMKEVGATEESVAEFEKEVDMFDKFRNKQIIHFYGAFSSQTTS